MPQFLGTLQDCLFEKDIQALKDNLYTVDLQLWREAVVWLVDNDVLLSDTYGDMSILGIFAQLRETWFGFLLWYTFMQQEAHDANIELHLESLKKIYIVDVLNLSERYYDIFSQLIDAMLLRFGNVCSLWCALDDNREYFALGLGNWMSYIEQRADEQITTEIM
jgi:hypothetical protein